MATQEELRLQAIRSQGNADPEPNFVAGPNAVNAQAQVPQRRELGSEQEAQSLNQYMKDTGRDGMSPEDWERRAQKLINWRTANPKLRGIPGPDPTAGMVATGPLMTGNENIDRAGQEVEVRDRPFPGDKGATPPRRITLPDLKPEGPEARQHAAAQQGVEFRVGAPAMARLAQAATINIPEKKAEMMEIAMQEYASSLPEGLPLFEWDADLGGMTFHRQITQDDIDNDLEPQGNLGKYRRTIIDEEGFSIADVADMANLGEIGSIIGSVAMVGKGKLTFLRQAGRGAAGGFIGREAGGIAGLAAHMAAGGEKPTMGQLSTMFVSDAAFEAAAGLIGETATRVIQPVIRGTRSLAARAQGRRLASNELNAGEVAAENAERRRSRAALKDVADSTDRKLLSTEGEASGNESALLSQAEKSANANTAARRTENLRHTENKSVIRDYKETLNGDIPSSMVEAQVKEAKDAVYEGSKIELWNDGFTINVRPKAMKGVATEANPDGRGIRMNDNGEDWTVSETMDFGPLKGMGLGEATYEAAALEARAHGRGFRSGTHVSEDAMEQWQKLNGKEGVGEIQFNPKARLEESVRDPGYREWVVPEGEAVAWMNKLPDGVTKNLVDTASDAMGKVRGAGGRFTKENDPLRTDFERFRKMPGRSELGAVHDEVTNNSFLKQDLLETLYDNYQRHVLKDGVWAKGSKAAHDEWLKESKTVLDKVLGPEEYQHLFRAPGNFRSIIDDLGASNKQAQQVLSTILKDTGENTLGFLKNNERIMPQLRDLYRNNRKSYNRAMAVLKRESPESFKGLQEIVKREVRDTMGTIGEKNLTKDGFARIDSIFSKKDQGFINQFLGGDYFHHLRNFMQVTNMEARRGTVKGVRAEAHSATVMLARALVFKNVFGRRQRIASAGQKAWRQHSGNSVADIISDPQQLRLLMADPANPVTSRQGMQFLSRIGALDYLGVTDINDPSAIQRVERWAKDEIAEAMELFEAAE